MKTLASATTPAESLLRGAARRNAVRRLLALIPPNVREPLVFGGARRQLALQRLIGGPSSVAITYNRGLLRGLKFRCLTSEKYFVMGADYERRLVGAILPLLGPRSVVYDVGAHAGFWSLVFSRACPEGSVCAFEPSPANLQRLKENVAQVANVLVVPRAASDASGSVRFSEGGSCSSVSPEGEIEVETVQLDHCGVPRPSFIKIGVEGHAARVLAGAARILEACRPAILCEVHNREEDEAVRGLAGYRVCEMERSRRFPMHLLAAPSESWSSPALARLEKRGLAR